MVTNNDHKTCYSCKSYIDELENRNESEVKQPELDERVYSIQHYVIKFVIDLRQISGFLRVFRFPPSIKLTATI